MAKFRSQMTPGGEVSIPEEFQLKLGVGPGSVLEWVIEGDLVIVRRAEPGNLEELE